jgi:glycosyltransferase involved in cell wall biosynthesis
MRIVFITTTLSIGGAEMMLLKLLQHLDRQRFEPAVISLRTKGEVGPRIEALGIPVLALGMDPGLPNPIKLLALVQHLRQIRPHRVQTWMYHADLLGGVAARLAACKHVIWGLRNSNLDAKLTKRSTLWVVRACAALSPWLPHRILSCSARAMAVHVEIGYRANKLQVIPNGFDLGRFQPDDAARQSVRTELGLAAETPLVGLIARYDVQKNHSGFIEAAALIHQQLPMVHFLLAGEGIDGSNAALNETIKARGLASCIHLLGRRDDMPRLMVALDVLASSSYGEAFPNVLGEAMACRVPCVVTDVGDSAEIVGDSGRVVPSGDMAGLARHIVELLSLPPEQKLALGSQARARVEANYEIAQVARRYMDFYERVAG